MRNSTRSGIGVPRKEFGAVMAQLKASRPRRLEARMARQQNDFTKAKIELFEQFPSFPGSAVKSVMRSFEIGSHKVGRATLLDLPERVRRAVHAQARHRYTNYDQLLRRGVPREQARSQIRSKALETIQSWAKKQSGPKLQTRKSMLLATAKDGPSTELVNEGIKSLVPIAARTQAGESSVSLQKAKDAASATRSRKVIDRLARNAANSRKSAVDYVKRSQTSLILSRLTNRSNSVKPALEPTTSVRSLTGYTASTSVSMGGRQVRRNVTSSRLRQTPSNNRKRGRKSINKQTRTARQRTSRIKQPENKKLVICPVNNYRCSIH